MGGGPKPKDKKAIEAAFTHEATVKGWKAHWAPGDEYLFEIHTGKKSYLVLPINRVISNPAPGKDSESPIPTFTRDTVKKFRKKAKAAKLTPVFAFRVSDKVRGYNDFVIVRKRTHKKLWRKGGVFNRGKKGYLYNPKHFYDLSIRPSGLLTAERYGEKKII